MTSERSWIQLKPWAKTYSTPCGCCLHRHPEDGVSFIPCEPHRARLEQPLPRPLPTVIRNIDNEKNDNEPVPWKFFHPEKRLMRNIDNEKQCPHCGQLRWHCGGRCGAYDDDASVVRKDAR